MERTIDIFIKNGFVLSFLIVGLVMFITEFASSRIFKKRIPGIALAVVTGLILAAFGKEKGIANIDVFSGMALLGGNMLRDFCIVSTALGASFHEIKKSGLAGVVSLFTGVTFTFVAGCVVALGFGYRDAESIATIAAGACSFIVGPVTGNAIGASSEVITLSIAEGVIKVIVVVIGTPLLASRIGLTSKHSAMVYGGIMGTTSGVSAGLAATDVRLVPYGALTATFYTGLAVLLCPTIFYPILKLMFP